MRLSRKAGALACDIRWIKYACTAEEYISNSNFSQLDWSTQKQGTDATKTYAGFSGYGIHLIGNEFQYFGYQPYITISTNNPGTVYDFADIGTFWSLRRYTIDSAGNYSESARALFTKHEYATRYPLGEQVGAVYSANGAYPDVKNGYTYVTVCDGYTIMQDSDGNYFAYIKG